MLCSSAVREKEKEQGGEERKWGLREEKKKRAKGSEKNGRGTCRREGRRLGQAEQTASMPGSREAACERELGKARGERGERREKSATTPCGGLSVGLRPDSVVAMSLPSVLSLQAECERAEEGERVLLVTLFTPCDAREARMATTTFSAGQAGCGEYWQGVIDCNTLVVPTASLTKALSERSGVVHLVAPNSPLSSSNSAHPLERLAGDC